MQLAGDMFDLNKFLNKTPDPMEYPEGGRCSGFIKLAPGNKVSFSWNTEISKLFQDLFMAHVSMSSLSWMQRILKIYKFGYDVNEVPGHIVTFSGYPAALISSDDYTITSAGLVFYFVKRFKSNENYFRLPLRLPLQFSTLRCTLIST